MTRRQLAARDAAQDPVFRWRGAEISRLEGFSDAVFAFAVTLLVVSLEVPRTFTELLAVMRGFGAFGLSFMMLTWVWYSHYQFFRRYGLSDRPTLLVDVVAAPGAGGEASIEAAQLPTLMLIYGAGFAAINLLLGLLYRHALARKSALELTDPEARQTRRSMLTFLGCVAVAALSSAIALLGPNWAFLSGMSYALVPLVVLLARRFRAHPA